MNKKFLLQGLVILLAGVIVATASLLRQTQSSYSYLNIGNDGQVTTTEHGFPFKYYEREVNIGHGSALECLDGCSHTRGSISYGHAALDVITWSVAIGIIMAVVRKVRGKL